MQYGGRKAERSSYSALARCVLSVLAFGIFASVAIGQTDLPPIAELSLETTDVLIKVERTACYGCSEYSIAISPNREVTVATTHFGRGSDTKALARDQRTYFFEISEEDQKKILDLFERYKFNSLENRYDDESSCPGGLALHHATITFTVRKGSLLKTVTHYQGCVDKNNELFPKGLFEIEKAVRDLLGFDKWLK